MGWELIMALRFFLLPKLEAIVGKVMDIYISKIDNHFSAVASLDRGCRLEVVQ
jgi:hypothetical protein